jgi:hypothetical protein
VLALGEQGNFQHRFCELTMLKSKKHTHGAKDGLAISRTQDPNIGTEAALHECLHGNEPRRSCRAASGTKRRRKHLVGCEQQVMCIVKATLD